MNQENIEIYDNQAAIFDETESAFNHQFQVKYSDKFAKSWSV